MAQSGNRPPGSGQPPTSGDRPPRSDRTTTNGGKSDTAAERARDRLAQQNTSGQKRQSASQRARAAGPATTKAGAPAGQRARAGSGNQRGRSGGSASRRASARNAQKRSTAVTAGIFGTAFVVLAVLIIVLVSLVGKTTGPNGNGSQPCPANVCGLVTHVPRSSFAAAGSTLGPSGPVLQGIYALKDKPLLKSGGKPLVVYLGSEYCPYCAATRWPLTVALSRFGTFKGLAMTTSSSTDVDPSTNTLSYYGSTYSSPYIAFSANEECTNIRSTSTSAAVQGCSGYLPLETPTRAIAKVFGVYDFPPYVPNTQLSPGGIPFVDFGNQFHEDGAFIDPAILAGRTHLEIAESLSNPVASPGQTILVGANYYSALICKLTGNKPASVCQMPVVKQAAATIDKKGSLGTP